MATPASDIAAPRPAEIVALLAPFPGRSALTTRMALICALTVLITSTYGTPEAAISAYIVFFINRSDRVSSVIGSVGAMVLVTVVVGLVLLVAMFSVNVPAVRLACMAVLSFAMLFLTSASKLRPVGAMLSMIVGFGLDELGLLPAGEAATRAVLYALLMALIPVGVVIAVNLVIGPSPRKLFGKELAKRLRIAARMLSDRITDEDRIAFDTALRANNHGVQTWLKLSKFEGTATAEDVNALRHAMASTTGIMVAVDLAVQEPDACLPAAMSALLASTLEQMAAILEAGGYPVDITLDAPDVSMLTPVGAIIFDDIRSAIENFAIPETKPDHTGKGELSKHSGFFDDDAVSNPEHVRFAFKTTMAAMFCYLLYQQLDWQGIHTCFITCYLVSLGSTAETLEKLTLRIVGCLVGALLGTAALIFLLPLFTSVGELVFLVFAGAWLGAWVAVGSPRIAYVGMQTAFAFFLCVLQGAGVSALQVAGPGFDLTIARDRLIGILIGNVVIYFVFTRVWPVSVKKQVDTLLAAVVDTWIRIARSADPNTRRSLAASALSQYAELREDLGLMHYEPSAVRPRPAWIASRQRALAELEAMEAPLYFAEGRAIAETDARVHAIARNIGADQTELPSIPDKADPPVRQPGGDPSAAAPVDALLRLIDARLTRVRAATPLPPSEETESNVHS